MANFNDVFPSKYLSKNDIDGTVTATVDSDEIATMRDGRQAWLLYFREFNKALSLNKTNAETLASAFGPDSERWPGRQVEIYVDESVRNPAGQKVGGIRLRAPEKADKPEEELAEDAIPF